MFYKSYEDSESGWMQRWHLHFYFFGFDRIIYTGQWDTGR